MIFKLGGSRVGGGVGGREEEKEKGEEEETLKVSTLKLSTI